MSDNYINVTAPLHAATKQGKLTAAREVFMDGDKETLQQIGDKTHQLENAVKDITATGGASTANAVSYNNDTSGITAVTVQGAIDELVTKNKSQDATIAAKAEKSDVQSSVSELKAKNTLQDTEIAKKANSADVTSQIQTEKTMVNAELEKKFDLANITQESGNAEDKVMSQKAVSDKLSDLSREIGIINISHGETIKLNFFSGKNYISSNIWKETSNNNAHYLIPCKEGDSITITAGEELPTVWAFLKSDGTTGNVLFSDPEQTKVKTVNVGKTEIWIAPTGTTHLYFNGVISTYDYTPKLVNFKAKYPTKEDFEAIVDKASSIDSKTNNLAELINVNSDNISDILSVNMFKTNGAKDGYLTNDGSIGESSEFLISEIVKVNKGDNITFSSSYKVTDKLPAIVGYSKKEISNESFSKIILGWTKETFSKERVEIPEGVSYIAAWGQKTRDLLLEKETISTQVTDLSLRVRTIEDDSIKETTIKVLSNENLRQVLENVNDSSFTNRYKVILSKGIYDLSSTIEDSELPQNTDVDSNHIFHGVFVPNFVTLEGQGIDETIIKLDLQGKTFGGETNIDKSRYVSTLNLAATSSLKNLTVLGNYTRYAVHDDFANASNSNIDSSYEGIYHRTIENCKIKSTNTFYEAAYGCGLKSGAVFLIKNCTFESDGAACYIHTNIDFKAHAEVTIENCSMTSENGLNRGIVLIGLQSGTKDLFHLKGNKTTGYTFRSTDGSIGFYVDGYGNSLNVPIRIQEVNDTNWKPSFRDFPSDNFIKTDNDGTGYFNGVTKFNNGKIKMFYNNTWVEL